MGTRRRVMVDLTSREIQCVDGAKWPSLAASVVSRGRGRERGTDAPSLSIAHEGDEGEPRHSRPAEHPPTPVHLFSNSSTSMAHGPACEIPTPQALLPLCLSSVSSSSSPRRPQGNPEPEPGTRTRTTHTGPHALQNTTLTMLPRMYTCSSWDTRPSRAVTVISRRAMLSESSAVGGRVWNG